MARRDANLAGLAALGMLGYKLANSGKQSGTGVPVEDRSTLADLRDQEDVDTGRAMRSMTSSSAKLASAGPSDEDVSQAMDAGYMGRGKKLNTETGQLYDTEATPLKAAANKPVSKKSASSKVTDTGDEADRLARRYPKKSAAQDSESRTSASRLSGADAIPGSSPEGWTGGKGERVTGTGLSRGFSNTANALAPIGSGVGKVVAELATAGRAQRAYNEAQAVRRAAEGMSPAEALAAKKAAELAAREAKTLNPNAWMAGPKGMSRDFKKGGAVKSTPAKKSTAKGWGQARGARAAKYY